MASGNCALVTRKVEMRRLCSCDTRPLISGYMIGSPTRDSAQWRGCGGHRRRGVQILGAGAFVYCAHPIDITESRSGSCSKQAGYAAAGGVARNSSRRIIWVLGIGVAPSPLPSQPLPFPLSPSYPSPLPHPPPPDCPAPPPSTGWSGAAADAARQRGRLGGGRGGGRCCGASLGNQ
eukprot:81641-Chlamydomonas_euryale.AAC.1